MIDFNIDPNVIDKLVGLMLTAAMAIVLCRTLVSMVYVYAFQSLVLASISLCSAHVYQAHHLTWMFYMTIGLKVILIPWVIIRVIYNLAIKREAELYVGILMSLIICSGLVILAYYIEGHLFHLGGDYAVNHSLSVSMAILLIGFFIMISRKKAITQMIGLLVMENGLFLGALTLTSGMPMIVELGISFDLLVGIIIMGMFVFRISQTFGSVDTSRLTSLRG